MTELQVFSPPKQQRSRASLERVLAAATEILERDGYDGLSVQEVCRRAGAGVGVIYSRLGSKEGLLMAVHARLLQQLDADCEELLGALHAFTGPTGQLVRRAVAAQAETFRRHERLLRVFLARAETERWIPDRSAGTRGAHATAFRDLLLTRRADLAHADPRLAVDVAHRMVRETLARQVVRGPASDPSRAIAWDVLVAELGRACAAYLLCREQA
jgi:AcrR family transcriptional regulator